MTVKIYSSELFFPAWPYYRDNKLVDSYKSFPLWVKENGGVLRISHIEFENDEDAILFKLKYM